MSAPVVLVVTRHPALVRYLREVVDLPPDTPVVTHVSDPADLAGKHVYGVLPINLAAHALCVTIVPLRIPAELRGQELSLAQVRAFAGELETFKVNRIGAS